MNTTSEKNNKEKIKHLISVLYKLIHIRSYPLRSNKLVDCFYNALEKELSSKTIVIASVNPLEAVVAAEKAKKKHSENINSIYYCANTLSNEQGNDGILSSEYRTKCGINWEKRLFASFDRVLIMECHKNHYYSGEFKEFHNKMAVANFPLFTKINCENNENMNDVLHFVYTGTLYRMLRNPQYLCDLLVSISSQMRIEVSFLGHSDCDDIIKNASEISNGAIEYLGMQSHDVAIEYINKADILLSIGNAESPMAPSKIYEYMSTGKPIIHVYTYDKDPCLEPLKKYGNSLLLKDKDKQGAAAIKEFLRNIVRLNYDDVERTFVTSTPAYTLDLIEKSSSFLNTR